MKNLRTLVLGLVYVLTLPVLYGQIQQTECGTQLSAEQQAYMQAIRDRNVGLGEVGLNWVDVPVVLHLLRASDGSGGFPTQEALQLIDTLNHFFEGAKVNFFPARILMKY